MRRVTLALLLAALCLPGLGVPEAGTHPDEATYLSIVGEMADRGAWLTAQLEGEPNFYKPPLLYWAQRVSMGALGETLFAARLPLALSALALALLVGALARRMAGQGAGQAEALAALLCLTSLGLMRFGRIGIMDVPLTLALALAAYGVWRGVEEKAPRALLWCGLGAGMAVMLKGPVGAVLVLLLCGSFAALRAPRLLVNRWTLGSALLAALVAVPWFAASAALHGRGFFDSFFLRENLAKFHGAWTLSGEAGLFGAVLVLALPWTFLFLGGLRKPRHWREPATLLPLLWLGSVLLVYSLPSVKFSHYMLPCVPPAILLAVRAAPPAWARWSTSALLALVGAGAAAGLLLPLPGLALAALAGCSVLAIAASVLAARSRLIPAAIAIGAASTLAVSLVIPGLNPPLLPASALAAAGDRPMYLYGANTGLHRFAAGRPVRRAWNEDHLEGSLREGAVVVVAAADFAALPAELQANAEAAARWPRLRRGFPLSAVVETLRAHDLTPLYEDMLLVQRAEER
ncbi:MAG: ArnT family glycosyltransferase [Myxococcaceae bacterium]